MKRLAAAFVLLTIACAVTVWTGYVFEKELNRFEKDLNALIEVSESGTDEKLLEEAEKLASRWEETSGLLRSVVLHDGIDELGRDISSLPQIIRYSDKEEMKIKCIEAINLIKNLKACEKVSFENVL